LRTLKDGLNRIIEFDNQIRELVRSRRVITLADIGTFRQLKAERKMVVRQLQSGAN
jgi:hypothetical protein